MSILYIYVSHCTPGNILKEFDLIFERDEKEKRICGFFSSVTPNPSQSPREQQILKSHHKCWFWFYSWRKFIFIFFFFHRDPHFSLFTSSFFSRRYSKIANFFLFVFDLEYSTPPFQNFEMLLLIAFLFLKTFFPLLLSSCAYVYVFAISFFWYLKPPLKRLTQLSTKENQVTDSLNNCWIVYWGVNSKTPSSLGLLLF